MKTLRTPWIGLIVFFSIEYLLYLWFFKISGDYALHSFFSILAFLYGIPLLRIRLVGGPSKELDFLAKNRGVTLLALTFWPLFWPLSTAMAVERHLSNK